MVFSGAIIALTDVVIVTDSLTIDGGSAKVALTSAMALARLGLNVTVFSASGTPSPEMLACPNLRLVTTDQGDALHAHSKIAGAFQGLWNRSVLARMNALLATLNPKTTIVHVHGWTKALSSSVIASVVRSKFPIVVTLHEYFTACPTGCLYLHRERKVCTLRPMSASCIMTNCDSRSYTTKLYRVVRQIIQRTAGEIPRKVNHFITVSGFSERILEKFLTTKKQFHRVNNPVDAVRGLRAHAEMNKPYVFIGRLSPEKGAALLADAAKRAGVDVIFIGDGPDRAAIHEINPQAKVTGWLSREAMQSYLQEARCLVVPSLWYETLGLVVLEAAAYGVPAIVPSDTAAFDLIRESETGLSFERGSVTSLEALLRSCEDSALIRRLSESCFAQFWSNPPTMESHIDALVATYKSILGSALPALRSEAEMQTA